MVAAPAGGAGSNCYQTIVNEVKTDAVGELAEPKMADQRIADILFELLESCSLGDYGFLQAHGLEATGSLFY